MLPTDGPTRADVIAARRGDAAAFARLVRQHAGAVCAITTAILGDTRAGEEIAQETFVCAWRDLGTLRDPDLFPAWLRQIARHRARNALRSQTRRREVPEALLAQLPDPASEPGEQLDEARQEAALWAALEQLDEDHREVLVLFYRQGRSVRQVADQLGLQEPAVRKRLSRARACLRDDVEDRLGRHLQRTAPGAAFLLGIVAALAPQPARAAARIQPGPAALLGGLAISLIALVALPCPAEPDVSGPHPAQTRAGRASLVRSQARPAPPAAPLPEAAPLLLKVRPGQWRNPNGSAQVLTLFQPARFWPGPDEAPWPKGRRVAALVDFATDPEQGHALFTEDIIARTRPLRTGALPDDPWAALVAIEVERLHAMYEDHQAEAAFAARYGLPAPSEVGWPAYHEALAKVEEEPPRLDLERVLSLARDARDTWPDHPVADFAALYELGALAQADATTWDEPALGAAAMEIVRSSSDPYVLDAAISQLANARSAALTADDLDLLRANYDDPDANIPRYSVARLALQTALGLGDLPRAASWMSRFDESTDALLSEVCTGGALQGSDPETSCRALRQERDFPASWLAARGTTAAPSWQSALLATVHRCALDGPPLADALSGEGTFDGTWRWRSWSEQTPLAACIETTPHEGPPPPDGTVVRLELLPPR